MQHKNIKRSIIIGMVLVLCIALAIEINILSFANKRQINRTAQIMLEQVENIILANEQSELDTIDNLKLEYIERANTVAYILEHNEAAQSDIDEQKKIAVMMGIDEIHLFDDKGVIFSGTVPGYYGVSFDSGEQVSYFKPMLDDKSLTMCQDVTPNTAEAKSMMYAITWDRTGTYMVQVGIEPVRLLQELKQNDIHEVVRQIPVYDGVNIYVADIKSGEVLGSSQKSDIGKTVYECGFLNEVDDLSTISKKTVNLNGFTNYCDFRQCGDYIIAVVHSTEANVEGFLFSIGIEIVWMLIAGSIVIYVLFKLINANKKIHDQMAIVSSLSDIYYSMHLIDLEDLSIKPLEANELMDKVVEEGQNAKDMLERIVESAIEDDYKEAVHDFLDISSLRDRLKDKNTIVMDAIDLRVGWLRISFITVETDDDKNVTKVILATQVIEEEKKREEELAIKANRDELTGLFNRRAYEDDLLNYPDVPVEPDFVYAAIDINGLKVVNDSYGHAAGDELIEGAAYCLKKTLGNYGRIYRTGGDEFVSMFFASEKKLNSVIEDLDMMTAKWRGELVDSLALSIGYVTKREFSIETVADMAKIADQRMYQAKAKYYSQRGIDRRGQAAAHTALCNLYTKILKINLTEDSYSIVDMDISEQTEDKGFTDTLSGWLTGFGKLGQVFEEDLDNYLEKTNIEYLKEYFKSDKTSISIYYRRKYEDGFKLTAMEMIPADDYTEDNQTLFLYVKEVDR